MTSTSPTLAERPRLEGLLGDLVLLADIGPAGKHWVTDSFAVEIIVDRLDRLGARMARSTRNPSGVAELSEVMRLTEAGVTAIDERGTDQADADETRNLPVLSVSYWRDHVCIGPLWQSGAPGCPKCLVTRLANSFFGPDQEGHDAVQASPKAASLPGGQAARRMVAALVIDHLARLEGASPSADLTVIVLDTSAFVARTFTLIPDSTCPLCAVAVAASGSDPDQCPTSTAKLAPDVLRTTRVDSEALTRRYVTGDLGLFRELRQDLQSPFGASSVELAAIWGRREPAIGRAATYDASRSIAILEGLERYAGLHRGGKRICVRAPYRDVADRAVVPTDFGVHSDSSYRLPGFRYRPFDPDLAIDWVEAYSFRRRGVALVPERAAFWGPRGDREPSFFYDTSNGCALGASIPEATLHGLRELVERDSYLLTWYRQLHLPEIDLRTATSRELRHLLRRTQLFTGFEIRAFESTMEHGLPSVWLVALSEDTDGPLVVTGSGAHPDPVQALVGGLYELAGAVLGTCHRYGARRLAAQEMAHHPDLVKKMEDHAMLGAIPETRYRYGFLLDNSEPSLAVADVAATICREEGDIRADLHVAVDALLALGLDVLVVDQTMPELRLAGLACVKALVPGLIPMTFGHANRRTEHLPRLQPAYGLPYPSLLASGEDLNSDPHPFP